MLKVRGRGYEAFVGENLRKIDVEARTNLLWLLIKIAYLTRRL